MGKGREGETKKKKCCAKCLLNALDTHTQRWPHAHTPQPEDSCRPGQNSNLFRLPPPMQSAQYRVADQAAPAASLNLGAVVVSVLFRLRSDCLHVCPIRLPVCPSVCLSCYLPVCLLICFSLSVALSVHSSLPLPFSIEMSPTANKVSCKVY